MATWQDLWGNSSEGPGGLSGRGFQWGGMAGQPGRVTTQPVPGGTARGPADTSGQVIDPFMNLGPNGEAWKYPAGDPRNSLRIGPFLPSWSRPAPIPGETQPTAPEGPAATPPLTSMPPVSVGALGAGPFNFQPQQGQTVNLPGFDSSRTDLDPKQVFGQFAQAWKQSGRPWGGDAVRAFVAQDPRWEIEPGSDPMDPKIRVKQDILNQWKPGTSIYQDVIRDSGGENGIQYINDPASAAALGFGPANSSVMAAPPTLASLYGMGPQQGVAGSYGQLYGSTYQNPNQPTQPTGLARWMQTPQRY